MKLLCWSVWRQQVASQFGYISSWNSWPAKSQNIPQWLREHRSSSCFVGAAAVSQTKAAYAQLRYGTLTEAHGSAQRGPRKMAGGCSLTQRAGPPGGTILRTRFWAQIPAHIWNRLPCTQQWGAGQSVPDYGLDSGLKKRSPKSDLPWGGASRFLCPRDPKERRHRRQQCLFNWQLAAEAQSMTSRTLCRQHPANNDGAVYAKTTSRLNAAEKPYTDTEHATRPNKPLDHYWSAN